MGVRSLVMETLSEKVTFMRESLQKSQTFTDNMVTILGSFDHRLSALETAMRPTQALSLSLSLSHTHTHTHSYSYTFIMHIFLHVYTHAYT
ncbi:hypothetical protein CsSME_00040075 [Camellia sinensis var. sinensis]